MNEILSKQEYFKNIGNINDIILNTKYNKCNITNLYNLNKFPILSKYLSKILGNSEKLSNYIKILSSIADDKQLILLIDKDETYGITPYEAIHMIVFQYIQMEECYRFKIDQQQHNKALPEYNYIIDYYNQNNICEKVQILYKNYILVGKRTHIKHEDIQYVESFKLNEYNVENTYQNNLIVLNLLEKQYSFEHDIRILWLVYCSSYNNISIKSRSGHLYQITLLKNLLKLIEQIKVDNYNIKTIMIFNLELKYKDDNIVNMSEEILYFVFEKERNDKVIKDLTDELQNYKYHYEQQQSTIEKFQVLQNTVINQQKKIKFLTDKTDYLQTIINGSNGFIK